MEIYKKLAAARAFIKSMPIKKAGENTFSHYNYFTPEQISSLVFEAESQNGLIHTFTLIRDENGLHGHLNVIDIESNEHIEFIQATAIPEIKATNVAQQIVGAVTYTLRYMLMTAFDIADNSLDFDAKDNREPEKKVEPTAKPPKIRPINDDEFARFASKLRECKNNTAAADLLTKTRRMLTFNDAQENIITQITDNI